MITFRALVRSDLRTLKLWLNTPHVYEWWGRQTGLGSLGGAGMDAATDIQVETKYGPDIDNNGPTHRFVIEFDGTPIGLIQWYFLRDFASYARAIGEDPLTSVGVDLLIGDPRAVGRGIGSSALGKFVVDVVFQLEGVTRVVAGPAETNARSIRVFEKAGFRQVRLASVVGEHAPEAVMVRERDPSA